MLLQTTHTTQKQGVAKGGDGYDLTENCIIPPPIGSGLRSPRLLGRDGAHGNEGREIRAPNHLIWSQTRCRCAIPPMAASTSTCVLSSNSMRGVCPQTVRRKCLTEKVALCHCGGRVSALLMLARLPSHDHRYARLRSFAPLLARDAPG